MLKIKKKIAFRVNMNKKRFTYNKNDFYKYIYNKNDIYINKTIYKYNIKDFYVYRIYK